jgi:hypothetical protein
MKKVIQSIIKSIAVIPYICIREMSVSNLEGGTGYPVILSDIFMTLLVYEIEYQRVLRLGQNRFPPNRFQFLSR